MSGILDSHQHIWDPREREYSWVMPDYPELDRVFTTAQARDALEGTGITERILVQAADSYEDTLGMVAEANADPTIVGVVGWAPLNRPDEVEGALALYSRSKIRGLRALTHDYRDPDWITRPDVSRGLSVLERGGLTLDVVALTPRRLEPMISVADGHPELPIVVDHLASPPVKDAGWDPWSEMLASIARRPNVFLKLSGLATLSAPGAGRSEWQRYFDHALACFGASRIMFGTDWPVCTLAGRADDIVREHLALLRPLSDAERSAITRGTAEAFYKIPAGSAA